MKLGRISALAAALFITPVWAATLTVSRNIDVEVFNGQKYRSEPSFFGNSRTRIDLSDGDHQIVVRLSGNLKNSGDAELYRTGYYVVTLRSKGDTRLKLATNPIRNQKDLKAFNQKPEFFLTNSQGQPHPFKMAHLKKEGMQISRNLVRELSEFNASGDPASLESRAPFAALTMQSPQAVSSGRSSEIMGEALLSEQMLHYWFQQADKPTRERFLNWAAHTMKK